jgi:hypothetical protein
MEIGNPTTRAQISSPRPSPKPALCVHRHDHWATTGLHLVLMLRLPGHLGRPGARPARPAPRRVRVAGLSVHSPIGALIGRVSGAAWADSPRSGSIGAPCPAPSAPCASHASHSGGPRAGAMGGARASTPMCSRIRLICTPSVMNARMRLLPPQKGHTSGKTS